MQDLCVHKQQVLGKRKDAPAEDEEDSANGQDSYAQNLSAKDLRSLVSREKKAIGTDMNELGKVFVEKLSSSIAGVRIGSQNGRARFGSAQLDFTQKKSLGSVDFQVGPMPGSIVCQRHGVPTTVRPCIGT